MIKKILWTCTSICFGLIIASTANADDLNGSYVLSLTGDAELSPPTSGDCKAKDTSTVAIEPKTWTFQNGKFSAGSPDFSIGATTCYGSSNERELSGTYSIVSSNGNQFIAKGMLNFRAVGVGVNFKCNQISLKNVSFTIVGTKKSGGQIQIQTQGAGPGSVYAEGPDQGGPTTCTADILNFVTTGSAFPR